MADEVVAPRALVIPTNTNNQLISGAVFLSGAFVCIRTWSDGVLQLSGSVIA